MPGCLQLLLAARQYGEVVLPDASTGEGPGTLATKLSRRAPREHSEQRGCKEGMLCPDEQSKTGAHFLPSGHQLCELYEYRDTGFIGVANL